MILIITVLSRKPGTRENNFSPLWSYAKWGMLEIRHEIIQNIIMFIPLGTFIRGASEELGFIGAIAICFAFSVVIEAVQYIGALGLCELDDVINNTIGGIIGAALCGKGCKVLAPVSRFFRKKQEQSIR